MPLEGICETSSKLYKKLREMLRFVQMVVNGKEGRIVSSAEISQWTKFELWEKGWCETVSSSEDHPIVNQRPATDNVSPCNSIMTISTMLLFLSKFSIWLSQNLLNKGYQERQTQVQANLNMQKSCYFLDLLITVRSVSLWDWTLFQSKQ